MVNLVHIGLLVTIVFILAGCGSSISSRDNYMSGTEGIRMNFVGQNPPHTIYVDSRFNEPYDVIIEAHNRGTSPSNNIETFFTGFDDRIVHVSSLPSFSFTREGDYRSRFNPEGGYDEGSAQLSIRDLGAIDTYEFPLRLVYCYEYETHASIQLCVDPNPHRRSSDDACIPASVGTSGQGAPIGISRVEMENMPGRVRLKLTVQHYGQGEVLSTSAQCRGIPARAEEDVVQFSRPVLGGIQGDCTPDREIKLRDGRGTIICTFELPDPEQAAYETVLQVELFNYMIKNSVQRNIKIINEDSTFR